jgi:hypothetical protein
MNNFSNYDPNQMMLENLGGQNNQMGLGGGGLGGSGDFNYNSMSGSNNFNNMQSNYMLGHGNSMSGQNIPNLSSDNLMNMANNIDSLSMGNQNMQQRIDLSGTNLNDLSYGKQEDNSSLIKSLTKEIISNLKENNVDLSDNYSYKKEDSDSESSSSRKKKKKKEKSVKEDIQDYVEEKNPVPSTNKYLSMVFDSSFDIKDFLLLFTLYFLLSQNMIKDFFAKYFGCLNPDEEGKIGIQGVILYGLILTVLFMLLKKVI